MIPKEKNIYAASMEKSYKDFSFPTYKQNFQNFQNKVMDCDQQNKNHYFIN